MKSLRIAVLLLAAAGSWAQSPAFIEHRRHAMERAPRMSLDEVEAAAMMGNAEIRAAARRIATAEARVPAAGALEDPMFMYRNWGTPLNQPLNWSQAQNMFMVQQNLPGLGKRGLRSKTAASEAEVLKLQLETTRRDVAVRVKKAFVDILRTYDELRIHDEQAQVARQAAESARIKYTVGKVPQQDVLKAQIAVAKLEEHLIMVEQDGEMARATLNSLMGRDPAMPLEIAGQYTTAPEIPSLLDLERIALENRPELRANQAEQVAMVQKEQLAKKAYAPDFTVGLGYMLMPPDAPVRHNYMAEITATFPWLNRRKHDSEIQEARTMTEATRAEFDAQRAAIFLEIQQSLIRVQAAQRNLRLYRDTLKPQAEATFRAAAAAYQYDRTDFLNLVDSQNMMLEVQTAYYRSLAEVNARVAELERAIGTTLPERSREMTSEARQ